jgi:hypothetical protein
MKKEFFFLFHKRIIKRVVAKVISFKFSERENTEKKMKERKLQNKRET